MSGIPAALKYGCERDDDNLVQVGFWYILPDLNLAIELSISNGQRSTIVNYNVLTEELPIPRYLPRYSTNVVIYDRGVSIPRS